jgi:hypothetical protein
MTPAVPHRDERATARTDSPEEPKNGHRVRAMAGWAAAAPAIVEFARGRNRGERLIEGARPPLTEQGSPVPLAQAQVRPAAAHQLPVVGRELRRRRPRQRADLPVAGRRPPVADCDVPAGSELPVAEFELPVTARSLPIIGRELPSAAHGQPVAGPEFGPEIGRGSRWGARRRRGFVSVGALGAAGVLAVPLPVSAAPARCEQAERYAAQSASQILRINSVRSGVAKTTDDPSGTAKATGDAAPVAHVGDARSAMVGVTKVNSAAVARMLDVKDDETPDGVTTSLHQQAPPTNNEPAKRSISGVDVGPVSLGDGKLTAHARWEPGMACAETVGEVTRATARLSEAGVLADGEVPLVRVPKVESKSTTELERDGQASTSVASAGLAVSGLELLGGAVKVEVLEAPSLRASMSTLEGGEVRYFPAVVQISGDGVETSRLDTAGDSVEITLGGKTSAEGDSQPTTKPGTASSAGAPEPGVLSQSPVVSSPLKADDGAPLPDVPDVPEVAEPTTESAPAVGTETTVTISLGDVRQASENHAIAARAVAMSVTIGEGTPAGRAQAGYGSGRMIDFDMGVMEAAAVAPEPGDGGGVSDGGVPAGGVSDGGLSGSGAPDGGLSASGAPDGGLSASGASDEKSGSDGGLPITGPNANVIALSGLALIIAGAVALFLGRRSRS